MSDNIDYDELDKAIAETQKRSAAKAKSSRSTKNSKASADNESRATTIVVNRVKPVSAQTAHQTAPKSNPPRRRVYMDFIGKPRRKNSEAESIPVLTPAETVEVRLKSPSTTTPSAPRRVARFATATPGMPNYRVANSHPATRPQSVPVQPIVRKASPAPRPRVQTIATTPVIAPKAPAQKAKVAPTKAQLKAQAKAPEQPSRTAAAASSAAKVLRTGPTSPDANNYSLGVHSPYLRNDAKIEKRPLSGNISEFVQDDKIEKNDYSEIPPKAAKKKTHTKHVVKKKEESSLKWLWRLLSFILVIAAGGAAGALFYIFFVQGH